MNIKFLCSMKSLFAKKAPTVVQTVAKEVTPATTKVAQATMQQAQVKYVPASTVMAYLSGETKEIASKYKTMVAFDKTKTYLSYRKNPNVHIRATYTPEGELLAKEFKFADGRTLQTTGKARKIGSSTGTAILKDKNGEVLKTSSWQHQVTPNENYKANKVIDTIDTSVKTKYYKDGKLDHGVNIQAKWGRGINHPIIDGQSQVVDRKKDILEYSIPAQRQTEYTTYKDYNYDKYYKTEPKISTYVEQAK